MIGFIIFSFGAALFIAALWAVRHKEIWPVELVAVLVAVYVSGCALYMASSENSSGQVPICLSIPLIK